MDPFEAPLRRAAKFFVDTHVKDGMVLGLGSGPMSLYAVGEPVTLCCSPALQLRMDPQLLQIQYIAEKRDRGELKGVAGVANSDVAASEAAVHGLPLRMWAEVETIDLGFEQGDALDPRDMSVVIGRSTEPQQPQLMSARLGFEKAKEFVVLLASEAGVQERLTGALPVVIEDGDWESTAEELDDIFLTDAEVWRRPSTGTSNPRWGRTYRTARSCTGLRPLPMV